MAGVGVHTSSAHGQHDAQVATPVGEKKDQHGSAPCERDISVLCWRGLVGAEAREGRLQMISFTRSGGRGGCVPRRRE